MSSLKIEPDVPPPPRAPRGLALAANPIAPLPAQEAVKPVVTPKNMSVPNSGIQDMNFKVDPDFHFKFKMKALKSRMTMKEMLEACFLTYCERYPD